jgi:transposase
LRLWIENNFTECSQDTFAIVFASMAYSDAKPVFGQPTAAGPGKPRLRELNRSQWMMLNIEVDRLIPEDHSARAIWDLVGQLDLSLFYARVKAVEGHAGQPPFDPRLMISIWVYGISRGISSARELSEYCEWEPGLQWLCAMGSVNYHSLSTFRTAHGEALKKLFIDLLGVLSAQGLVEMERVAVDGTKIRAHAGDGSFRKGEKLDEHLQKAAAHLEALEQEPEETLSRAQQAARERSRRERRQRVTAAQQELSQLRQQRRGAKEKAQVQVSTTEAEARIMKQPGGGGFAPSYNVQLATDEKAKIIVATVVSTSGTDTRLLAEVVDQVRANNGAVPDQVLVDGGYVSADNLSKLQERGAELIGPVADMQGAVNQQARQRGVGEAYLPQAFGYDSQTDIYQCPEGKVLIHIQQREREGGRIEHEYRAKKSDCEACPHKQECCPKATTCGRTVVRSEPTPAVKAFREKMRTEPYKQLYRKRSEIAEFPNAWLKEKFGFRRFRLSGLAKVGLEGLWAVITYNAQQWTRLVWLKGLRQAAA